MRCRQCHTEFRGSERRISLIDGIKARSAGGSENSTLFSLAELTRQAARDGSKRSAPPTSPPQENEKSGLIDLSQLTPARDGSAPGLTFALQQAPLGVVVPTPATTQPRAGLASGVWISGGMVLSGVIVALALILRPVPAAPAAAVVLAPEAPPAAVVASVAPPVATAETPAKPSAPKPAVRIPARPVSAALRTTAPNRSANQSSVTAPSEKPPPKKPRADACAHCKGDLLCHMACASK